MKLRLSVFVIGVSALCFSLMGAITGFSEEQRIRAKVGIKIKSGDRIVRAKSRDRLMAGDLLRIYVHPEKPSHVYVVYTDHRKVMLMNSVHQKMRNTTLVMPSLQEYYEVDGKSAKESFTIVCSPEELPQIQAAFKSGTASYSEWARIENVLEAESRIELNEKFDRPFSIAGNVRGGGDAKISDPFVKQLQIFSGDTVLVKKYTFRVKK